MARARRITWISLAAGLCLAAGLASCWVLPGRLAFGPHGSFYTFGYTGDEYAYAQRLCPLPAGGTAGNTINGLGDPAVISPYFLEDGLRGFLTLTGLDPLGFIWAWRALFPVALAGLWWLLARELFPRRRPAGPAALPGLAAAAALPLLYVLYDLVTPFPPAQGFLNRVPTNVEYLLAVLLCWLAARFLKRRVLGRGIGVALAGVAFFYLRPYTALPWGLLLVLAGAYLLVTRRLSLRHAAMMALAGAVALLPWLAIFFWNRARPAFQDMVARCFGAVPYEIHPEWRLLLSLAAGLLAAGFLAPRRWRALLLPGAAALAALPFLVGLCPFARELLWYDRFGCFYLVLLAAAGLCLAAGYYAGPRGRRAGALAWAGQAALGALALSCAGLLAFHNACYDFEFADGPYASVVQDERYLAGYEWVRAHTPAGALFLVDDGYDWAPSRDDWNSTMAPDGTVLLGKADLFQLVTRRRELFRNHLHGAAMTNAQHFLLTAIQRGTFGAPLDRRLYADACRLFPFDYIFWRKTAPVPRGYGQRQFENVRRVVYHDDYCEIWEIPPETWHTERHG